MVYPNQAMDWFDTEAKNMMKTMGQEYGVMHCQGVAEVVVVAVLAVPVLAEDVLAVAVLAVPVLAVAVLADAMLVLAVPIVLLRKSH